MKRWAKNISGSHSMALFHQPDIGHRETHCHLCLREERLTLEHIPPKSAFNDCQRVWERLNPRSKGVDDDGKAEAREQTRRDTWQGGFYVPTLCRGCNNGTGATSAAAYVRFVKDLAEAPRLFDPHDEQRVIRIREDTQMIARQIAVMILAVEDVRLARKHEELRRFARGDLGSLVPPFRIFGFLVPDRPESGTIVRLHARLDTFAPGTGAIAGEISLYPFGFVYALSLQASYRPNELADITHWFSQTDPIARRTAWLKAPVAVTVLDSLHCILGNPRFRPQIDTLPR